jgi:uncharacterized membrane protein
MKQEKSITDILTNFNTNVSPTERVVSGVAGGALIAYGIKQGGTVGALLSVLGGGLACAARRALSGLRRDGREHGGRDATAEIERGFKEKPIHKQRDLRENPRKKSVTINKSPAELYQFWRNFENLPKFMAHPRSGDGNGRKNLVLEGESAAGDDR